MDAAGSQGRSGRGAPRLLEHCAGMERLTRRGHRTARARVEDELGGELARFLLRALTGGRDRRVAVP